MSARVNPAPGPTRTPAAIDAARLLVDPALHAAVGRLSDERMQRVAGYQLGLWDADGEAGWLRSYPVRGSRVRCALVFLLWAQGS